MELHPGQQKVLNDKSSKKLVVVGVRWGKTTLAIEMAIQRCRERTGRIIRLYEHSRVSAFRCRQLVYDRLEELKVKCTREQNGIFYFEDGSQIIIDVFPYTGREELIFDDGLDHIKDLTIMITPIGWTLHKGPSMQNPTFPISEDIRKSYGREMADALFDGDLNDEWEKYCSWYIHETGREPGITRSMFNRVCSDPLNEKMVISKPLFSQTPYRGPSIDMIDL